MGSRLSCSCPDAYCFGGDERRMRIYAELFELSADGLKWIMVESRLLYIAVLRSSMEEPARITAHSQTGKTVLDVTLTKGQKVEKISECFVFWRQGDGRTMGVNTLSARDAAAFLSHTAAPVVPTGMMQHNSMAQVSILASWDGKQINCKERQSETTMVSINPLNMIFHYNHGLVNVDLLECFGVSTNHPNVLHISYASHIYEFEFNGEAVKFITQVLNMSSLLLSRTTCNDVAVSYLQRQRMKNQDKLAMLSFSGAIPMAYSGMTVNIRER
uniref:Mcl1_mid domain-containing protein n=1 Tax=Heterorhabditis bacteriophora TaxID=37862 RepID=A0A1I7XRD0_HETBA